MYKNGYVKVMMATPKISIGNPLLNVEPIVKLLDASSAQISLFPELCITGYSALDLFFQKDFINQAKEALSQIIEKTTNHKCFILGLPILVDDSLYNVAVVVDNKKVIGIIPKLFLPNHGEFLEKRWFSSGNLLTKKSIDFFGYDIPVGKIIFKSEEFSFGVEVCQDMWMLDAPSDILVKNGAHIIFNLSASPEYVGKDAQRRLAVLDSSRRQKSAYVYTSSGTSESVVDVVFSAHKLSAVLGILITEADITKNLEMLVADIDVEPIKFARRTDSNWTEQNQPSHLDDVISVDFNVSEAKEYIFDVPLAKNPFIPELNLDKNLDIAEHIQIEALASKLSNMKSNKVVIGVSGGVDSTLALIIAHKTFIKYGYDLKDIIAVTMPSENTSTRSLNDAKALMQTLGVTSLEIPIDEALKQHLKDIKHGEKDVTYENAQARIRTLNLMDLANKNQAIVVGTGDLSEIALGWMTFNGDHMSMYSINAGLTKTFIVAILKRLAESNYHNLGQVIKSIVGAPVSPELLKDQKTEDLIGSYEINDFILYHLLVNGSGEKKCAWLVQNAFNIGKAEATKAAKNFFDRFYQQQFKRQAMPEGPKILRVSLSPRSETKLPSDIKRS